MLLNWEFRRFVYQSKNSTQNAHIQVWFSHFDSFPVLNVNTVVEILISFLETQNWRTAFLNAIPLRKTRSKPNMMDEYDYKSIRNEKMLYELSLTKLPRFEFRNVLHKLCIQQGKKLEFEKEEFDIKKTHENRFHVRAKVDDVLVGEGEGSSVKIATSYAAWKGLKALGIYSETETESNRSILIVC